MNRIGDVRNIFHIDDIVVFSDKQLIIKHWNYLWFLFLFWTSHNRGCGVLSENNCWVKYQIKFFRKNVNIKNFRVKCAFSPPSLPLCLIFLVFAYPGISFSHASFNAFLLIYQEAQLVSEIQECFLDTLSLVEYLPRTIFGCICSDSVLEKPSMSYF